MVNVDKILFACFFYSSTVVINPWMVKLIFLILEILNILLPITHRLHSLPGKKSKDLILTVSSKEYCTFSTSFFI